MANEEYYMKYSKELYQLALRSKDDGAPFELIKALGDVLSIMAAKMSNEDIQSFLNYFSESLTDEVNKYRLLLKEINAKEETDKLIEKLKA